MKQIGKEQYDNIIFLIILRTRHLIVAIFIYIVKGFSLTSQVVVGRSSMNKTQNLGKWYM
jgi:hypothetical protein